jgi:hypothetical protein
LNEIVITRLSPGSIFKLLCIGMASCQVAFTVIVLGAMLLSGGSLETPGGEPITYLSSYTALLLYLFLGILSAPFWAGMAWLIIYPCMWLYSKIRPINIRYVPHED